MPAQQKKELHRILDHILDSDDHLTIAAITANLYQFKALVDKEAEQKHLQEEVNGLRMKFERLERHGPLQKKKKQNDI